MRKEMRMVGALRFHRFLTAAIILQQVICGAYAAGGEQFDESVKELV